VHNGFGASFVSRAIESKPISALIEEMVRRIVRDFSPEKIILFGSHARGDAGADSDVDLLVVARCDGETRVKVVEIRRALADLPVAKDIIVVTPEYFGRYRDVIGTIVWPAMREGRILYERAA
jgi:predicted nucleotidyltransferase